MSIGRRPTGWQVRVSPFPKQTVPTKKAALELELALKLKKVNGLTRFEKPTLLKDEIDGWLERKKVFGGKNGVLARASMEWYEKRLAGWKRDLGHLSVAQVTRLLVEQRQLGRYAVAPVVAVDELKVLKTVLLDAAARGQTTDLGILNFKLHRPNPKEGRALDLDGLGDLVAAFPERIRRAIGFTGTVGLRWGETFGLTDDRVDLSNSTIFIPAAMCKERRDKTIALGSSEMQLLREQMLIRPVGASLLFPSRNGTAYTYGGFRTIWLSSCKRAGMPDLRFHSLRVSAISLMLANGVLREQVAQRVGHRDMQMIEKIYRKLYPEELHIAGATIDRLR